MRIAILADIHGNLAAFEAALKHAVQQKPDTTIINGDIVIGSPDSQACLALAMSLGCPILRGNHERYAATFGTPQGSPQWTSEQFAPIQWAVAQLSPQERQALAQLPASLRFPELQDLFFVHASERGDHDNVKAHTSEEELAAMFPTARERYIIRAHNHTGQVRLWERGFIVTCGAVGLALDGNPTAQYLLLDQTRGGWNVQHMSVPYPIEQTIQRYEATNYLTQTGPMGRLFFRELVTASQQIVPFLHLYAQWTKVEPISLEAAVERFLSF